MISFPYRTILLFHILVAPFAFADHVEEDPYIPIEERWHIPVFPIERIKNTTKQMVEDEIQYFEFFVRSQLIGSIWVSAAYRCLDSKWLLENVMAYYLLGERRRLLEKQQPSTKLQEVTEFQDLLASNYYGICYESVDIGEFEKFTMGVEIKELKLFDDNGILILEWPPHKRFGLFAKASVTPSRRIPGSYFVSGKYNHCEFSTTGKINTKKSGLIYVLLDSCKWSADRIGEKESLERIDAQTQFVPFIESP